MDTLADFMVDEDEVDLTDLLDISFDPNSNESSYLNVTVNNSGDAELRVDGTGSGTGFDLVATFTGVGSGQVITYIYGNNQTDTLTVP